MIGAGALLGVGAAAGAVFLAGAGTGGILAAWQARSIEQRASRQQLILPQDEGLLLRWRATLGAAAASTAGAALCIIAGGVIAGGTLLVGRWWPLPASAPAESHSVPARRDSPPVKDFAAPTIPAEPAAPLDESSLPEGE